MSGRLFLKKSREKMGGTSPALLFEATKGISSSPGTASISAPWIIISIAAIFNLLLAIVLLVDTFNGQK